MTSWLWAAAFLLATVLWLIRVFATRAYYRELRIARRAGAKLIAGAKELQWQRDRALANHRSNHIRRRAAKRVLM